MADRLNGKVAVVTGASSGIGEATVRALVAERASVVAGALPMDPWDLAREVWTALNRYMTSPPSQQVIRADIESVPQTNVLEALDTTVAAYLTGRFETEAEGQERMYKNFLWLLKKPRHRRYPTQRGGTRNPQQASARYTDS
jgi:NAD(P)-dependent dehydrogenase (short-subunit alcohol dehydrogenase family)